MKPNNFDMYKYGYTLIHNLRKKYIHNIIDNSDTTFSGVPIYDTDDDEWQMIKELVKCYGLNCEPIISNVSRTQFIHLMKFDGYYLGYPMYIDEFYKLEWYDSLEFIQSFKKADVLPPLGWLQISIDTQTNFDSDSYMIKDKETVKILINNLSAILP